MEKRVEYSASPQRTASLVVWPKERREDKDSTTMEYHSAQESPESPTPTETSSSKTSGDHVQKVVQPILNNSIQVEQSALNFPTVLRDQVEGAFLTEVMTYGTLVMQKEPETGFMSFISGAGPRATYIPANIAKLYWPAFVKCCETHQLIQKELNREIDHAMPASYYPDVVLSKLTNFHNPPDVAEMQREANLPAANHDAITWSDSPLQPAHDFEEDEPYSIGVIVSTQPPTETADTTHIATTQNITPQVIIPEEATTLKQVAPSETTVLEVDQKLQAIRASVIAKKQTTENTTASENSEGAAGPRVRTEARKAKDKLRWKVHKQKLRQKKAADSQVARRNHQRYLRNQGQEYHQPQYPSEQTHSYPCPEVHQQSFYPETEPTYYPCTEENLNYNEPFNDHHPNCPCEECLNY